MDPTASSFAPNQKSRTQISPANLPNTVRPSTPMPMELLPSGLLSSTECSVDPVAYLSHGFPYLRHVPNDTVAQPTPVSAAARCSWVLAWLPQVQSPSPTRTLSPIGPPRYKSPVLTTGCSDKTQDTPSKAPSSPKQSAIFKVRNDVDDHAEFGIPKTRSAPKKYDAADFKPNRERWERMKDEPAKLVPDPRIWKSSIPRKRRFKAHSVDEKYNYDARGESELDEPLKIFSVKQKKVAMRQLESVSGDSSPRTPRQPNKSKWNGAPLSKARFKLLFPENKAKRAVKSQNLRSSPPGRNGSCPPHPHNGRPTISHLLPPLPHELSHSDDAQIMPYGQPSLDFRSTPFVQSSIATQFMPANNYDLSHSENHTPNYSPHCSYPQQVSTGNLRPDIGGQPQSQWNGASRRASGGRGQELFVPSSHAHDFIPDSAGYHLAPQVPFHPHPRFDHYPVRTPRGSPDSGYGDGGFNPLYQGQHNAHPGAGGFGSHTVAQSPQGFYDSGNCGFNPLYQGQQNAWSGTSGFGHHVMRSPQGFHHGSSGPGNVGSIPSYQSWQIAQPQVGGASHYPIQEPRGFHAHPNNFANVASNMIPDGQHATQLGAWYDASPRTPPIRSLSARLSGPMNASQLGFQPFPRRNSNI